MVKISRTFELLDRYVSEFKGKEVALAGKKGGKWEMISSEQYYTLAHEVAQGLIEMGVQKGDRIGLVSGNRPEWNILDMAISLSGAVSVPIYPTISEEEYRFILNHAEVKLLFVSDVKLHKMLGGFVEEIDSIEEIISFNEIEGVKNWREMQAKGANNKELESELAKRKKEVKPDEMVTLIYTSGTTGNPKGVMLSHTNLIANFTSHCNNHNLGEEHRVISFLPLCHIYERCMNYHFQYKGMSIYYVESLAQIMGAVQEVKPHMFNTVPRLLERIYDGIIGKGKQLKGVKRMIFDWSVWVAKRFEYKRKFSLLYSIQRAIADKLVYSKWREALGGEIQIIISGGAALQPRIGRVFGCAKIYALEGYGLTETSPVIAVSNKVTSQMKTGTNGPILPGVEVKFGDDGEILCKGPSVMLGYYKAPELTKEVIDEDGYFHTGDIGILDEGVYLKITDRKKEIFKLSGGKYIAPQMIENILKESLFIEQAMIVGENEKFASAIISPNFDYIHSWAAENKIHFKDNKELVENDQVKAMFRKAIREKNKHLGQHEEIKQFRLVCEAWTPNTGELSPTLKLKRNILMPRYQKEIEAIYGVKSDDQEECLNLSSFAKIKELLKKYQ